MERSSTKEYSMEPQQQAYDTFASWLLARLQADLSPTGPGGQTGLWNFLDGMYSDMRANPDAYGIPHEPFVPFFARVNHSAEETALHESLKAARLRVRKVVMAYLEFLFGLGQASEGDGPEVYCPRPAFERLTAAGAKQVKTGRLLPGLERRGLCFSAGDPVQISAPGQPDLPGQLAEFSQACGRVKEEGFYLFRRCDLGVYTGKLEADFADALRVIPEPFRSDVRETDEHLVRLKFKREIFPDHNDAAYLVRYTKKGGLAAYWCRIQEPWHADLHHLLRWRLDLDLSPRLFQRLDASHPGLADKVFWGLKACSHCYPGNCMDRCGVERGGVTREVCKGSGWDQIGHEPGDYQDLRVVLDALNAELSGAR
jgi:hypothetical protein